MEPCAASDFRVLALGNELLADDAFGILVGRALEGRMDVVSSSAAGFRLLDDVLGAARLLVVDTVITGNAAPGTIYVGREEDAAAAPGGSPHRAGIFEILEAGRRLGLPVPREVMIIAVEAGDCTTVGGAMHPAVRAAIPAVVNLIVSGAGTPSQNRRWTSPLARTAFWLLASWLLTSFS